jgi:hypothetical protein
MKLSLTIPGPAVAEQFFLFNTSPPLAAHLPIPIISQLRTEPCGTWIFHGILSFEGSKVDAKILALALYIVEFLIDCSGEYISG